jgi:hypothetical protein
MELLNWTTTPHIDAKQHQPYMTVAAAAAAAAAAALTLASRSAQLTASFTLRRFHVTKW